MTSEGIFEPFAVPEIFADGIGQEGVTGGVFRCVFWSYQPTDTGMIKCATMRLYMPAVAVPAAACSAAKMVLRENVVSLYRQIPGFGC